MCKYSTVQEASASTVQQIQILNTLLDYKVLLQYFEVYDSAEPKKYCTSALLVNLY